MPNDVTSQIDYGDIDGEWLVIKKCVCGEKFELWDFSFVYTKICLQHVHPAGASSILETRCEFMRYTHA